MSEIFEMSTEKILASMNDVKDEIVEVVLMGVNNKIKEQYVSNQAISQETVEWALNIHKK